MICIDIFDGCKEGWAQILRRDPTPRTGIYGIATIMLARNVPDKYAMERMACSTPATLKGVYRHTMRDKQREVTGTVNQKMNDLLAGD